MRKYLRLGIGVALVAMVVSVLPAGADPNNNNSAKLRQAVTLDGVVRHMEAFQQIATAAGGNRYAGLQGHNESADYVIEQLTAAGYEPYTQTFNYDAFFEVTPAKLNQVSPTATTYVNGNDFRIMSFSGSGETTALLVAVDEAGAGVGPGCESSDFSGFTAGRIALIRRGGCTFRIKTDNAQAAGASAILVYNNVPGVLNGTLGLGGLSAIPSVGLTQTLGQSLVTQLGSGPVTMHVKTDSDTDTLSTENVFAELPGRNTNNVVMAGAHLDSVTTGPGINDNGSGSAAILETAIQMAKVKPSNTVRFAWWSAEESGLIGSINYVNSLSQAERDRIALYLNFDMIGSPNYVRMIYDGDNSAFAVGGPSGAQAGPPGSGAIEQLFIDYFNSQGLATEPTPFNGRSDYGPFIASAVGIPSGGLFTGAEQPKTQAQVNVFGGVLGAQLDPCYHASCDTIDNYSPVVLAQMSDAVAHAIITYAQNTEAVNQVRGKGNFKRGGPGNGNGSTGGANGGLHDEHQLDES